MSGKCNDPRFRQMLHNYEMGLLSEAEETEFELHLYNCEFCLKEIEKFEETARHLKFDPVIREELQKLAAETENEEVAPSFFKRLLAATRLEWSPPIKISLVAIFVFVIILLNLVRIEIGRQESVQASPNNLIVTDFINISGDTTADQLSAVAMNLLVTDLSESPSIRIISKLHIMEILAYLGFNPKHEIDREIAFRVANETGSNLIISGNIVQTQPHLVLTSQIIDVKSGVILASQKTSGNPGEDIFSVIDRLASEVRIKLLPRTVVENEVDCSIADITTHSEEAYYLYLQGLEDDWAFKNNEARRNFRAALELDSTFAMAYYLMSFFTTGDEQSLMIAKAMQYSEKCSCKERFLIRSRQALLMGNIPQAKYELEEMLKYYPQQRDGLAGLADLENRSGNFERAIELYEEVITIYPKFKNAYNELAYLYSRTGNFEKAAEAVEQYIKLAPGEPNPRDSKGEIYARYGRIDEATAAFKKALELDPQYNASNRNLAMIYILKQAYDSARTYIDESTANKIVTDISYACYYSAVMKVRQGLFSQALDILDKGIISDINNSNRFLALQKHWQKAMLLHTTGREREAFEEIERCRTLSTLANPNDKLGYLHYYGQFLAETGRSEDAERVAQSIREDLAGIREAEYGYWYVKGSLELQRNRPAEAIICFLKAQEITLSQPLVYLLARAYLEAGQTDNTVRLLEDKLLSFNVERLEWSIPDIKAHYYLGRAYEESGKTNEAAQSYEAFLKLWEKADVKIMELDDARNRLARLKS